MLKNCQPKSQRKKHATFEKSLSSVRDAILYALNFVNLDLEYKF